MGVYKMLVLNCQKMLEINCHFLLESTCRLQLNLAEIKYRKNVGRSISSKILENQYLRTIIN